MCIGSDCILAWFISASFLYVTFMCLCVLWFVPPSLHFCSLPAGCFPGCRSAPWVMTRSAVLWSSAPQLPLYSLTTSPECRYPLSPPTPSKSTASVCRLLTHNFSVFLFCSSVLHLHPCRYCSFVLSPHPPQPRFTPCLCIVDLPYVRPAVMANANPDLNGTRAV